MRGCKRRMTKVKLKEATKELNQKAGVILEESARVKRNADALLQSLQHFLADLRRSLLVDNTHRTGGHTPLIDTPALRHMVQDTL